MGKHGKDDVPRTGTGHAGGHGDKPPRGQVSVTSESGSVIWKATASLFGGGKKKK